MSTPCRLPDDSPTTRRVTLRVPLRVTLRVTRAEPAADGIQLFELRDPDGTALPPFDPRRPHRHPPAQRRVPHLLALRRPRRQGSRYLLAVKRDAAGRGGSVDLVDGVRPGDSIEVSAPRNLFGLVPAAPSFIFVAGGIGITPILSMIHWLRAHGDTPFRLYYLTRTPEGTAFLDQLGGDDVRRGRVVIHHDHGVPDNAFDLWPVFEQPTKAHIYCCGPAPADGRRARHDGPLAQRTRCISRISARTSCAPAPTTRRSPSAWPAAAQ